MYPILHMKVIHNSSQIVIFWERLRKNENMFLEVCSEKTKFTSSEWFWLDSSLIRCHLPNSESIETSKFNANPELLYKDVACLPPVLGYSQSQANLYSNPNRTFTRCDLDKTPFIWIDDQK